MVARSSECVRETKNGLLEVAEASVREGEGEPE